jgi:hypothetical protein
MAFYFQIHSQIWQDPWVFDLPQDQKLLFVYLFSKVRANLTGLYETSARVIASDLDMKEQVREGLAAYERAGKVLHSGNWVWVTNLLRYNAANVKSPKTQQYLRSRLEAVPDMPLKQQWLARYGDLIGAGACGTPSSTADEPEPGRGNGVPTVDSPQPHPPEGPSVAPTQDAGSMATPQDAVSVPHPAEASSADGASVSHPTQQQQRQHFYSTDQAPQQNSNTHEGDKTESAGADGGRPP